MATGEITHIEFPADDVERAKAFYEAVAGWKFQEMEGFPGYFMFQNAPQAGGAIGKRGEAVSKVVRNYINVPSIEEAVKAAEAHGGKILTEIQEVPGMGRWAGVLDSEGTEIGFWENASS